MHPIEEEFVVCRLMNTKGDTERVIGFKTYEEARKWLDDHAVPKLYYIIRHEFRRQ